MILFLKMVPIYKKIKRHVQTPNEYQIDVSYRFSGIYYISEQTQNYSRGKSIYITKTERGAGSMQQKELVFRFHNPNSDRDTYNALMEIFVDAGCKKLKAALIEAEHEKAENSAEKE